MDQRKNFEHNKVHLISSRMQEGLPMVPTSVMNGIIWGILARGKSLYDVKICHFIFLANHFHMVIVVSDPEAASAFVGYVKSEISHAVNRMLGRRKRTIWDEGYDSPVILDAEKVKQVIAYIYLNPARAHLEESIQRYPGVSSWEMYSGGSHKKTCRSYRRTQIPVLGTPDLSIREQRRLLENMEKKPVREHEFVLEPDAWLDCFGETEGESGEKIKEEILQEIDAEEKALSQERKEEGRRVIGATSLRRQSMEKEYVPTTFSPRMLCLSTCKELRKAYLEYYASLCQKAREVYERWKLGDLVARMPAGVFAPRVPLLVVALPG